MILNLLMAETQIVSDVQVWNQEVSQGKKSVLKFAQNVVHKAEKQEFNTNNIFVTGHSLGGIEASYVAQQTGLGGMPFELTGILSSTTAKGDGSNFVSVVTYGDPVVEYTFDTEKGSAFVTAMAPEANNEFNHYGKVVTIGDKADSIAMQQKLAGWNSITGKNITSILSILPNFAKYHLPVTQAANMRFKLSLYSLFADLIYTQHGPVIPMSNDSIAQAMSHALPVTQISSFFRCLSCFLC